MSSVDDTQTMTPVRGASGEPSAQNGTRPEQAAPTTMRSDAPPVAVQPALPPLAISALMVTKADLIAALRVYLPHLSDVEALDGGERFLLRVGPHPDVTAENGAA